MSIDPTIPTSLVGQLLIAMPQIKDLRFARTVIYICAHTSEGAMGLVVNRLVNSLTFPELLDQLNIHPDRGTERVSIHFGGPVESGRGFVLHSSEYRQESTLMVDDAVALTATVDVLRDIAAGQGPRRFLLALGYAGWGPGQLDHELIANGWLTVESDENLVFGDDLDAKWNLAIAKLGINISMLSGEAGHA